MITVAIGQESRSGSDITESWINQQVNRRLRDGARVCVAITLKNRDLDMILRTSGCPSSGGGGRLPNRDERRVFEVWNKLDLQNGEVHGGRLVAFLKQIGGM
jgi:hypothetical protein